MGPGDHPCSLANAPGTALACGPGPLAHHLGSDAKPFGVRTLELRAGGYPVGHRHPARMGFVSAQSVQFFRSTLLPAAIVVLFGLALFAVSARIWLPGDMAAPAPIA